MVGYPAADSGRLRAALRANQGRWAVPVDRPFTGRLEAEEEASMAKRGPLPDALQQTDRLLGQIVPALRADR